MIVLFWQTLFSTFCLIFLAELGDKTQLATILVAAQDKPLWAVFLGSSLALVLSALVGVLIGSVVSKYLPPHYLQKGAGIGFIIMGILLFSGRF